MIYFDNAATTFPKPPTVVEAVCDCMENWCGNPGRGSHIMAVKSGEALFLCREELSEMFKLSESDRVVFTMNATHALNTAIFGLLEHGDHVLISDMEHNSVLRPIEHLKRCRGVEYDIFQTKGNICENISRLIKPNTKAVICIHSSNIVNKILPAAQIGLLCKQKKLLFILDASQSAGKIDINMKRDNISALCAAGHKGLMGPQGTGILLISPEIDMKPFMYGGSGIASLELDMPKFLPDRLEAGTAATPAIWGLYHGIKYINERGANTIAKTENDLAKTMHIGLSRIDGVELYSKVGGSICLFNIKGMTSQAVSEYLDKCGICTRPGLHCAPLAHKTVGTPQGAVRASVGVFNSVNEIEYFLEAVRRIRP